jgi:dihydroorotase
MKLLFNARIFTKGNLQLGYLEIKDGKISDVGNGFVPDDILKKYEDDESKLNCENAMILPGFIDTHVHFRDMNQAYKETLSSGSKGAISAGVTTVLTMPNTNPPLSTPDAISQYIKIGTDNPLSCNIGLFANLDDGFEIDKIGTMSSQGVFGIKIYPGAH